MIIEGKRIRTYKGTLFALMAVTRVYVAFLILVSLTQSCFAASQEQGKGVHSPAAAKEQKQFPLLSAKAFSLKDANGNLHSLSDYHGRPVALFFFCGCPWCHHCARLWGKFQRSGVLAANDKSLSHSQPFTLVVFSGDSASAHAFVQQTGLDQAQTVLLPDPEMHVTTLYDADPCPRVFVVNPQGQVQYTNDHKDDAVQVTSEVVIASRALDALRRCVLIPMPQPK